MYKEKQGGIKMVVETVKEKLNVNKYIEKEDINKTTETDQFKITVVSKDMYLENS